MPATGVRDGFGLRREAVDPDSGDPVDVLAFAPALVAMPAFAPALGERVARLAAARHASYARVRRLDRPAPDALELVSDHVAGWRLSQVLALAAARNVPLDISAALNLLRQLIPAVALFARHQRDLAIGCLAPERLILTPQGRLVIAEYVLGSVVEKLQFSRDRLWRELRVVVPAAQGGVRVTPRADVLGMGVVALALFLGRPLTDDEVPGAVPTLVERLTETSGGLVQPLAPALRNWLGRALQLDQRTALASPQEAQVAFEEVLASERGYVTTPALLEAFVARIAEAAAGPAAPAPAAPPDAPSAPARAAPTPPPAPPLVREPGSPAEVAVAPAPEVEGVRVRVPGLRGPIGALGGLVVLQALVIAFLLTREPAPLAGNGELVVESRPPAARVRIDGEDRGVTPLTVRLAPGTHVLEVRSGTAEPRVIPLTIRAGVQTAQYVELAGVAETGTLEIRSEPSAAQVSVNGQPRGTTPLILTDLPPGDHDVVVAANGREVRRTVRVEAGRSAELVVPIRR
ncbi:MAG: PEGA domain-containing protein [Acidobacteriota bacterium]